MVDSRRCGTLLLLALLVLVASAARVREMGTEVEGVISWEDCTDPNGSVAEVLDVQSDNTIVKPGADLGLAICLRAKASIDSGHIDTVVYYRGFKVWKASKALCDSVSCPVKEGIFALSSSQRIPRVAIPGQYQLHILGRSSRNQIFCVKVGFVIK